jgi:hypothetical protein
MKLKAFATLAIILSIACLFSQRAGAASAQFTPSLQIGYSWDDNVQAIDPDKITPIAVQWANYFVGLDGSFKSRRLSLSLGGHAGYSEYVSSTADLQKLVDMHVANLNYLNLNLIGDAQYLTPNMSFDLHDTLVRDRLFSQVFGLQNNADFSDFYAYTDDTAFASWSFQGKSPITGLIQYTYQNTVFDNPTGNFVSKPADSIMNMIDAKFMYKLNPKADVGVDLQVAERLYGESIIRDEFGFERKQKISDYDYYQPLLDFDYKFSPKSTLTASGGMQSRHFYSQPDDGPTLKDYSIPVVRIKYNQAQPFQYNWDVGAEYSTNTYGIDLYYTYWQLSTELKYYIRKSLYLDGSFIYAQDTYSLSTNDLANVWAHNRLDNLYIAGASVNWDALQKAGTPYLSFNLKYGFMKRDSNIDGKLDDYVTGYPGAFYSYNTQVNTIFAQVLFNPTVLIGQR